MLIFFRSLQIVSKEDEASINSTPMVNESKCMATFLPALTISGVLYIDHYFWHPPQLPCPLIFSWTLELFVSLSCFPSVALKLIEVYIYIFQASVFIYLEEALKS